MKLATSDLHKQPFRSEKFKSQKRNFIEIAIQFLAKIFSHKEKRMYQLMAKVCREEKVDIGIINGDFMESMRTERGLETQQDLETAFWEKRQMELLLGVNLMLNAGNHELGYILPLSTDSGGGISKDSINNFLRLAERKELYYSFIAEGFRIIFVPYLFTEEKAKDFNIELEKSKFLEKMKKDLIADNPVVLFIHDPDSLDDKGLFYLIDKNRKNIKLIFCGHYHSEINLYFTKILIKIFNSRKFELIRWIFKKMVWLASSRNDLLVQRVEEYFQKRKNIPSLIKEFNIKIIPAPGGMYGIGGGFFVLDLRSDGTYSVKKHKI
jgi:hypothetical protein